MRSGPVGPQSALSRRIIRVHVNLPAQHSIECALSGLAARYTRAGWVAAWISLSLWIDTCV